ncbi:MAG: YihY/virulence factor BrkB family protein [Candidatus Sericytochromatia bacterium]
MSVQIGQIKNIGGFLKEVFAQWNKDKTTRMAAALSYYTIFSIPPLLIMAIAFAGFFFGQEAAQGQIVKQIQGLIGKEGAETIQGMINSARRQDSSFIATIIGIVTLLVGASGVFAQLQDSLNSIWGVEPKSDRSWTDVIKERLMSFTMVFSTGFLLMASLIIDAILSAFMDYIGNYFHSDLSAYLLRFANIGVSFLIITAMFALIYKVLPDVRIYWKDVALGSIVTSILFAIGKFGISLYLGNTNVGVAYGAAGSLIVIMVWIFYASLIFFFGAEFTQVYTRRYGERVDTIHGAIIVQPEKHKVPEIKEIPSEVKKQAKKKANVKQRELIIIPIKGSQKDNIGKNKDKLPSKTNAFTKLLSVFIRMYISNVRKSERA